ncbi:MAG: Na+/melibiose symporter and related transporter [Eubacteriaceae bacterium]|nr:Na+/melibiose symporter and related transporter [Eubacteriaceae bacterium]
MKKELSKTIKTFYGIGDLGFSLMTSVELLFFVFFLTNVAKFSLPMVALIGSVTSIVDAILSPFYGAYITGTKALKWGRYRSWMLIAPPLVVVLFMVQFSKVSTSEPISALVVCIGFILSHIVWNLAWVANVSLIPLLGKTPDDRALLSARRGTWSSLSGVFFSYIGMPLAVLLGAITNNEVLGFTLLAGILAMTMMIGYWIVFKMTDGYETTGVEVVKAGTVKAHEKVPVSIMLKSLFQNVPLLVLLLSDFFRYISFFIGLAASAYYFTYVVQNMAIFPVFLLLTAIAGVVGSYISSYTSQKFSNRTTSIVSLFGLGISLMICKFLGFQYIPFLVFYLAARLFLGVLNASLVALYSDVVTYGEWKTGENASGFIMGIMNVSLKSAIISRGLLIPIVLASVGFVAGADPATASLALQNGIINIFVTIPGLCALASGVILTLGYKLTKAKLAGYQADIDERKNQAAA